MKTILVTGATGNLGREVVKQLSTHGFMVVAASRHPEIIPETRNVRAIKFDYEDHELASTALFNVDGLFLVAPPLDPTSDKKITPLINIAQVRNLDQVVLTSALGADKKPQSALSKTENFLKNSWENYTIIRPNFFMENFTQGGTAQLIKDKNVIFEPAGDSKTSFISVKDIARTVLQIFRHPEKFGGQAFNLTGSEALSRYEVASILSHAWHKDITYNPITEEQMKNWAQGIGLTDTAVNILMELYDAVKRNQTEIITHDVRTITGKQPLTFSAFIGENALSH